MVGRLYTGSNNVLNIGPRPMYSPTSLYDHLFMKSWTFDTAFNMVLTIRRTRLPSFSAPYVPSRCPRNSLIGLGQYVLPSVRKAVGRVPCVPNLSGSLPDSAEDVLVLVAR